MKIKFLQDYIGRETAMQSVKAGEIVEIDQQPAIELIHFGVAEEVAPRQEKKEKANKVNDVKNQ